MDARLVSKCAHAGNGVVERHIDVDGLCNEILDLDKVSFRTKIVFLVY